MTGGELGCIRVVQVGHLFVPVLGLRAAQVRSRYEGVLALDFDFCLEGVCEVRVVLVRFAPIHQEDGDGPGACGDSSDACGVDGPYLHVERKAAAIGNVVVACPRKRYRFRVFVLLPLPHRSSLAFIVLDRHRSVVGPPDHCAERVRVFRDQEAQAHRRREEALFRGLALLRRLLGKTGRFRHLVEVVVFVGVAALLGRRAGRNQEAGQVPVRRDAPIPAAAPMRGRGLRRGRSDRGSGPRPSVLTLPAIRKTQDRFCKHLSLPHGSMSGVRALIFTTDGEHNITAPPS